MADSTSRMLRLLSLLQAGRDWPGPELAARLEVSERTVRRDVERLRVLGYPVHAERGADGGYRLEAGAILPPLLLDDDEAVAIAISLRTAAGGTVAGLAETALRALAKLEQVLPARLRVQVQALQAYTVPLASSGPTVDAAALAVIAQACRDHERMRFRYRARDGPETRRLVEPDRLVSSGWGWYLLAWDVGRRDWRTFRVDRLDRISLAGIRFRPRPVPGGDAAAYVEGAIASRPARHTALLTVHAPLDAVAGRVSPGWGELEAIDSGSCRLRAGADSLEWLAVVIGLLGADFTIHEPAELADHVRALAGRLARGVSEP